MEKNYIHNVRCMHLIMSINSSTMETNNSYLEIHILYQREL